VQDQLTGAALKLAHERRKREEVERSLADVERECAYPMVVPIMMKIFESLKLNDASPPAVQ
jgi:hypothetical protein